MQERLGQLLEHRALHSKDLAPGSNPFLKNASQNMESEKAGMQHGGSTRQDTRKDSKTRHKDTKPAREETGTKPSVGKGTISASSRHTRTAKNKRTGLKNSELIEGMDDLRDAAEAYAMALQGAKEAKFCRRLHVKLVSLWKRGAGNLEQALRY
jgi:hypothetical protein